MSQRERSSKLRVVWAIALGLGASGCGLLLDASPSGDASAADARPQDAASGDTVLVDAVTDAPDGAVVTCPVTPDPDTVVLYTFDRDPAGVMVDETGRWNGSTENVAYETGVCGSALHFLSPGHGHVPNHEVFEMLDEGSIELYAKVPRHDDFGIISRDWLGAEEPGHFTIFTNAEGIVIVRMQDIAPDDNAVWLCSNDRVPIDTWFHIGVNWGDGREVELWVEHALATNREMVRLDAGGAGLDVPCGTNRAGLGIGGNTLSWIFGAYAGFRSDTTPNQLTSPFSDGIIDEVHIRSVRRDFSTP